MLKPYSRAALLGTLVAGVAVAAVAAPGSAPTPKKKVNLTCIQTAVEKRENAIIAAVDAYATKVKTALIARRDTLKAAWNKTDAKERRDGIRAAWNAFRGTWKNANRDLHVARKAAWEQFKKDRRACGKAESPEDTAGQAADANL